MNEIEFYWIEAKQLDRVTNFSTEVEILKRGNELGITIDYYCTFKSHKKDFGIKNIHYLGLFKNRYIKAIEFNILVVLKCLQLVFVKNNCVIMVNQDLIKHTLPGVFFNSMLRKKNKFVVDIRTTPTNPKTFESDMKSLHSKFRYAVSFFDGLSFITPFMEKYVMTNYKSKKPTVNWSSGVDSDLFDYYQVKPNGQINKEFKIFYHGGISLSRGNLNLVKACQKLVNEGYDILLLQIGVLVDSTIKEYINSNKLEGWCKLLPPKALEEMPQYIANSDLPVLPFPQFMAWRVSSPIKLMEYLAMGKKVLAPKIEAFTDVFGSDEEFVFYYNPYTECDYIEIADRIKEIIEKNLLSQYNPEDNVHFVKQNYTWKIQADKLFHFCSKL